MDKSKLNKAFKSLVYISFIIFTVLYISQSSGYFDYKNRRKVAMTNSQIKQFENDIKEGKKVDLKKYIDANNKNYQNKISKVGLSISVTSEKAIQKIIEETFKVLSKFVGE